MVALSGRCQGGAPGRTGSVDTGYREGRGEMEGCVMCLCMREVAPRIPKHFSNRGMLCV